MEGTRFDECDVCFLKFDLDGRIPKILGCGHTFCLVCLLALARDAAPCPCCRLPNTTVPHDLETNYKLAEALEQKLERPDPKRLFVARLPQHATRDDVVALFTQFGDVEGVRLIHEFNSARPGDDGHRQPFGYVQFCDETSSAKALSSRPIFFGDRKLFVDVARPKGKSSAVQNRESSGWKKLSPARNGLVEESNVIEVPWVPPTVSKQELRDVFSRYGAVQSVEIGFRPCKKYIGKTRRHAYITYVYCEAVDRACRDKFVDLETGTRARLRFRRYTPPPVAAQRSSAVDSEPGRRPVASSPAPTYTPKIRRRPNNLCALL